MAVDQLLSPMPKMTLEPQYVVQFEAIDPTTGAAVTGVTVNNVSLTTNQAVSFGVTDPVAILPLLVPTSG